MAETTNAPNNKSVSYGVKPQAEATTIRPPKAMRKTAKRAIKRGMISEKAAKKHLGGY